MIKVSQVYYFTFTIGYLIFTMGSTHFASTAFAKERRTYINAMGVLTEDRSCTDSWQLDRIWEEEGLDFPDFKTKVTKNQDLLEESLCNIDDQTKIPHISHHVWFTNPKSPREMSAQDQNFLEKKIRILNNQAGNWRSILWINTDIGLPGTIALAERLGMEIRFIDYLPSPFHDIIRTLIEKEAFDLALATDLWRMQVVKDMGGFYSDNDYELYTNIDNLTRTFHSFFGFDDFSEVNVGNSILAATKNHPILVAYYKLVYRNIFGSEGVPHYICEPCCRFSKTIMTTGPTALTLAIAKSIHTGEFKDIVLPHGVIFSLASSIPDELKKQNEIRAVPKKCHKEEHLNASYPVCLKPLETIGAVGNDQYSGSWIKSESFEALPADEKLVAEELGVEPDANQELQYKPYQWTKEIEFFESLMQTTNSTPVSNFKESNCKERFASLRIKGKSNVAFTALEFGPYRVGGVAAIINSMTPMLQKRFMDDKEFQSFFIMPYYSNGIHLPKDAKHFCSFTHAFNYKRVHSKLLKTELSFRVQGVDISIPTFLIEPDERLPHLFDLVGSTFVYGGNENSDLLNRLAYYGSALAGLTKIRNPGDDTFFDIVHSHSFGGGWFTSLLNNQERPITIGHLHNLNWDQGTLGAILCSRAPCNLMRVIMSHSDHIIAVSDSMIKDGATPDIHKSFNLDDLYRKLREENRITPIPNGFIHSDFDPTKKLGDYNFDLNKDIADSKFKIKNEYLKRKGFISDPSKPLFVFISRYSGEKGPDMLDAAITAIKELGGSFISMGVRMSGENVDMVKLQEKYKDDPDVYIMKGNYVEEQLNAENTGILVRAAADFNLVPSHEEAFGLVPIEGFTMGSIAITSLIGGMKDYIRQFDMKNLSEGNSFSYDEFSFAKYDLLKLEYSRKAMVEQIGKAFHYYETVSKEQRSIVSRRLMEEAKKHDFHAPEGAVNKLIGLYKRLLKEKAYPFPGK